MVTYRIKNWDELYETAETRKLKRLTWVPIPNKHDGRGLRRLMRREDGVEMLGAWLLILQVASKMPQRGILEDRDGPLQSQDISDKVGASEALISRALELFSGTEIGWISREYPGTPAEHPGTPVLKGREGKGIEGKGIETAAAAKSPEAEKIPELDSPPPENRKFPSLSDFPKFCEQIGYYFPATDEIMLGRIVMAARQVSPDVSDIELLKATQTAGKRNQTSAALFEKTIPQVLRTWQKHLP